MSATDWTREQVEALLKKETFGYQRIPLPYGLATKGRDRVLTAAKLLPESMAGKSVLDFGCHHGYFCFEAAKRGARRVVGFDNDPEAIRKARLLADCLGLKIEFEVRDIERDPVGESFDYVLCLNVLHHLRSPLTALDALIGCTREHLALEVQGLRFKDRLRLGLWPVYGFFLARAPVIYLCPDAKPERGAAGERFRSFITPRAVVSLLAHHRTSFAQVELLGSEHKKRYLIFGRRRRIEHLIVVSGPVSAGKSVFCRRLLAGEMPSIAERLQIDLIGDPPVMLGTSLKDNAPAANIGTALFHYGFLRPYMRQAKTHARDEALDVLDTADRMTFVTIWAPPDTLVQRITQGEIDKVDRPSERHLRLREEYRDLGRVVDHYESWIGFTSGFGGEHLVAFDNRDGVQLASIEEWRRMIASETSRRSA